jgi:hypothetical protein
MLVRTTEPETSMADDAELQKQVNDELKPAARELAADHEGAKGRMQRIVDELSKALQAQNVPLIQLHLNTLNGVMSDYAALVARGKALIARVGRLRSDDERSAAAKALAALTQSLGELQGRMDRNYLKLKELQNLAHTTLAQARVSNSKLAEAWAEMESYLASNVKLFDTRLEQSKALQQLATGAQADRDAKELAVAQSRSDDRKNWKPTVSDINSRLIAFFSETGKQLTPDQRDQFTRDRIKFNKTMVGIEAVDKKIEAIHQAIKALAIKPIDVAKAVAAMGIPPGQTARVKKALEGSPLVDALGALAKDLKLDATGGQLLTKLQKAKLL